MSTPRNNPPAGGGQLGLWDTVSIIVGIVIGTTIFYVPGGRFGVFSSVANPWAGLVMWGAGGLLALIGALCYAELATTYPRSGGDYVYLTRAFGPWAGFLFGWAQLALVLTASIGAMAYVFGFYLAPLALRAGLPDLSQQLGWDVGNDILYAGIAVIVLSFLNILGVTLGKIAQNILTIVKVLGILAIIVAGFVWGHPDNLLQAPLPTEANEWHFGALAIILVLYAYGGWSDAAFVAAEVRQPRRNIPRALILGTVAITIIYLLVNAAYLNGLGFAGVRAASDVPGDVLRLSPLQEEGATAMSLIIMVSALGAANGLIFAGTRVYATLGADYRLFAWLGTWRPGRGSPIVAVLLQAVITLGLLAALGMRQGHEAINNILEGVGIDVHGWQPRGAFENLVSHTAPVFWFFFLLTGLSLFVLREKDPHLPRPFMVPAYPILPLVFCSMCIYMLYTSIAYVQVRSLLAFGVLWIGVFLYLLARLVGMRAPAPEPELVPHEEAPGTFARVPAGRRVL
jgi:APA family basic amino acid/polyamine antiporter